MWTSLPSSSSEPEGHVDVKSASSIHDTTAFSSAPEADIHVLVCVVYLPSVAGFCGRGVETDNWHGVESASFSIHFDITATSSAPQGHVDFTSISIQDITAFSTAPEGDVLVCVEELRSFGGFRGRDVETDQLNIDGSTPTLKM